jgi:hypothetical protein
MGLTQPRPVAPPTEKDKETLKDYTSVVQSNLEELFLFSHTHTTVTTIPADSDGVVGDIKLVEDTSVTPSVFYIYAKFSSGWKRAVLL